MKFYKNILILGATLMSLSSCNDFLSEVPSRGNGIIPETVEDIELILAGAYRNDEISTHQLFMSDDVRLDRDFFDATRGRFALGLVYAGVWDRKFIHVNFKDYMWMYRYQNVMRSNLALTLIPDCKGSEYDMTRLTAEAYFKRAYNMFALTNVYVLPYSTENLDEPGLPLRKGTAFDEDVSRSSIKETFDFIEADLQEALKCNVELSDIYGVNSPYRCTIEGVYAFAARFYLSLNDYDNALKYANLALDKYGEDHLVDLTTKVHSQTIGGTINIDGVDIPYTLQLPWTYQNHTPGAFSEEYFFHFSGTGFDGAAMYKYPSEELLALYNIDGDQAHDLRYQQYMVEQYAYHDGFLIDYPMFINDGGGYSNPSGGEPYNGPSVAEMFCIKAECEARGSNWQSGINTINRLRAKRISADGQVNLTASTQQEAIAKILQERRREMPIIKRLYDLRRLNNNADPNDDVTVVKDFYVYNGAEVLTNQPQTYTLQPKDRRYAAPIPESDIMSSGGVIKQNTY